MSSNPKANLLALVVASLGLLACADSNVTVALGCTPADGEAPVTLGCAALPDTVVPVVPAAVVSNPVSNPMKTINDVPSNWDGAWDYWAWNSFIAMNWPALEPMAPDYQRGIPNLTGDSNTAFATADHDRLTVWETFMEKREVFFHGVTDPPAPGPWNKPVHYGGPPPAAGGTSVTTAVDLPPTCRDNPGPSAPRFVGASTKLPNDLDETVEVSSEALEEPYELCQGHVPDPQAACSSTSPPACCDYVGQPVGPRVWKGQPTEGTPVVYEVKVNWDFYNYVSVNGFYSDATAFEAAKATKPNDDQAFTRAVRLPFRTSASELPQGGQDPGADAPYALTPVAGYSAEACLDDYKMAKGNSEDGQVMTPCPAGSLHLKAAWMLLDAAAAASGEYHTADGYYFSTQPKDPNDSESEVETCTKTGNFGLVGLHIIQRTHTNVGNEQSPVGGTFVFATWEHVNNDSAGFTYANFLGQPIPPVGPPVEAWFPALSDPLEVKRQYTVLPVTEAVNDAVHEAIAEQRSDSVWLNYRLIGTQFVAVDSATESNPRAPIPANSTPQPMPDPMRIGQPQYLANLVIETNRGLQKFQGQPPGVTYSVYDASSVGQNQTPIAPNDGIAYARNDNNTYAYGSPHNMGGCMGCHGVAQLTGYTFSFVLRDGQKGASIDTDLNEDVDVPPFPPSPDPG